jgi:hypothetical protein
MHRPTSSAQVPQGRPGNPPRIAADRKRGKYARIFEKSIAFRSKICYIYRYADAGFTPRNPLKITKLRMSHNASYVNL